MPGHGQSPVPTDSYTLEEIADALVAKADELGVESFDYAGVSVSGAIALEIARKYPTRIKHSVVVCSAPYMGGPEGWAGDPESARRLRGQAPDLQNNAGRVARVSEIDAAIGAWTSRLTADAVLAALETAEVPSGKIYTVADIAADPHYAARGMLETVRMSDGSDLTVPGFVPKLSETPGGHRRNAPALGQDTDAVLRDTLGLTVYMVTHDLDSLFSVCDRIAVLGQKRVLVEGTLEDMLAFDDPWVQAYFKGKRARSIPRADQSARSPVE